MATVTYDILVRNGQGQVVRQSVTDPLPDDQVNAATLRDRAGQALAVNAAFLAIGTPSNAQVVAQVQRLTRECSALIRLLTNALDDTTGT